MNEGLRWWHGRSGSQHGRCPELPLSSHCSNIGSYEKQKAGRPLLMSAAELAFLKGQSQLYVPSKVSLLAQL